MNSARERLGKLLAQIRRKRGLSTYDVAKACGVAATNITRMEKGTHSVGVDQLDRVANVLGHEVDLVPKKNNEDAEL
jgi:transcriptional regulator with XRE-family HTH domain